MEKCLIQNFKYFKNISLIKRRENLENDRKKLRIQRNKNREKKRVINNLRKEIEFSKEETVED